MCVNVAPCKLVRVSQAKAKTALSSVFFFIICHLYTLIELSFPAVSSFLENKLFTLNCTSDLPVSVLSLDWSSNVRT